MAPTYLELEQALQNAAMQVETMSAIIGYLVRGPVKIYAEDLENNHARFSVIVTPNEDKSITIELKEKNDQ